MHRDVSLSRIQGAAIPGEGADGDGGKSFEASASGNDDLVLSLCFLVREDCWRYGGFGRHCGHLLGLKGGTHCSLYAESQSEVYPESINLYRFSMKIEAPLCRYHGGESNIVGAERQSAIAPSMTRLAQDSLRMSKTKGDVSMYGDSDDSNVYSIQQGCPMQRLYVGCCDVPPELAPIVSPVSQPLERQGANSGRCLNSRLVCIVYLVLKDRCPEVNRRADC